MAGQVGGQVVGGTAVAVSPVVVGDASGTATLRLSKSDAGTDDIEMYSAGVHRCTLRLSSTENFNLIIRDGAGAAVGTLAFNTADASLVIPAAASVAGSTVLSGLINFNAAISPAALAAGDNPNYAPTGLTTASLVRLTGDAGGTSAISGMVPTVTTGRLVMLANVSTAVSIQITHDATSTAANRFFCPNNANLAIPPNGSRLCWYDATSSRWRVFGAVA